MISWADNKFAVSGPLTIDTVRGHRLFPFDQKPKNEPLVVDMAQVDVVDSAAVSLMLSWLRQAQIQNVDIAFIHVPTNLHSLVDLYGLSEVLPLNYS
ncbi:MAG: STAS domain-containing protein [Sideroxydans sp.]